MSVEPPPARRRASFLPGAIYGPESGMLRQNGERLHVIDAVNSREYAYNLAAAPAGVPVSRGTAERLANQRLIQDRIDEVGAYFHFDARK